MDDKIFDILNDLNMDEEQYEVHELSEIQKARLKEKVMPKIREEKRKKSNQWKKIAIVAVVCFAFSGGTLYGKQFLTKKEELSTISGAYRLKKNMKDYEIFLGKSVKGKDSTVTLDSVLWDGTELLIMTTRTFEKELNFEDKPWLGVDIFLDGEILQSDMMSSSYRVDEHTFKQIMRFGVVGNEQEKELRTEFCFYDADDRNEEQWIFRFTIENEKFKEDTLRIPIHKTYEVDGGEIEIVEFTRNALGDKILCQRRGEQKKFKYWAILGEDNLGNKVEFATNDTFAKDGVEKSFNINTMQSDGGTTILYTGSSLLEEGRISEEAEYVTLGFYVGDEMDMNYDGFKQVGESFSIHLKE